jgi:anaerobic selenocysteine-containing dehydrogenase
MSWDVVIAMITEVFQSTDPEEIAFLMGETPNHLFDLVSELAAALGAPAPVRFSALEMFDARATLQTASEHLFGQANLLHFDLEQSELVLSFGANFLETWLSPVAYTRGYSKMRQDENGKRGYVVQFEARMSQTGAVADEWIPIVPGTEAQVALALGRLVAEERGGALPEVFGQVSVDDAAELAGVEVEHLQILAKKFAQAERPLAIPGNQAMGQINGLQAAKAILALNALVDNIGNPGGVFLSPPTLITTDKSTSAMVGDITALIESMQGGQVKALFVHGVNPIFEIPKAMGFEAALENVPLVVSFASFPDETALQSDYIFPDHAGLESFGYQKISTGTRRSTLSGAQPVVAPFYDTRATADVFLAVGKALGGKLREVLPFEDEVAYIESKVGLLLDEDAELIAASEIKTFLAQFQQYGGWWAKEVTEVEPREGGTILIDSLEPGLESNEKGKFFLIPYVSPILAEKGANKPWLQETPDPTTTVMWNTWVEINPETAEELGLENNDVVRVVSGNGVIEAPVYKYPAIRPDTIAIPFGQGHTAYGRYAEGRGVNPADLLSEKLNEAGDLIFIGIKVDLEKTGRKQELARLESRLGVYGE